jgi:hypothetical protein
MSPDDPIGTIKSSFDAFAGTTEKVIEVGGQVITSALENLPENPEKATEVINAVGNALNQLLAQFATTFQTMSKDFQNLIQTVPPAPKMPPPVPAEEVLQSIAQALTRAEYILNHGDPSQKQSASGGLVVAEAKVDLHFQLQAPGGSATADVTLRIEPRPYS